MNKTANKYFDVWKLVSIFILCLYGLFLIYPLFKLLYDAVVAGGEVAVEDVESVVAQNEDVKSSIGEGLKV